MRVAVTGAAGRMGKTLIQAIAAAEDLTLGAAFEHPDSIAIGEDAGELAGVGRLEVAIGADPAAVLEQLANQLTNKIIHTPSVQLKNAPRDEQDAIARLTVYKPDLILVDWSMPVMDGLEFVREEPLVLDVG